MAKDGTNRGSRRVRAGDKPALHAEKITAGKAAKVLEAPDLKPATALSDTLLPSPAILTGTDMPEPSEYLRANQKDGKPLGADTLFIETWRRVSDYAYDQFFSTRLVQSFVYATLADFVSGRGSKGIVFVLLGRKIGFSTTYAINCICNIKFHYPSLQSKKRMILCK